jgi:hypothetical protein
MGEMRTMIHASTLIEAREDHWRTKVLEAQQQYEQNRNEETRADWLRVLKHFTVLVSHEVIRPTQKGLSARPRP